MARKKTTEVVIGVKTRKLTEPEKSRLRKALKTAVSIMDRHDLTTLVLDGFMFRKTYRPPK